MNINELCNSGMERKVFHDMPWGTVAGKVPPVRVAVFVSRPRYLQILREFLASDTDYEEEQHVEHLEGCKGLNREKKFFSLLIHPVHSSLHTY
jgi:hypothetical protein